MHLNTDHHLVNIVISMVIRKYKDKAAPFIRGPLVLSVFKKFRDLGMGALLVYLNYSYKYEMQRQQKVGYNKWWPDANDPSWVKITNHKALPFFRHPQQKYHAIQKCLKAGLIEVKPKTKKFEAPVIRLKKLCQKK